MTLIAIAFVYDLAYHTIRCARSAGHSIHVLGANTAAGLRYSLVVSGYSEFSYRPDRDTLEAAITEIERCVRKTGADAVLPTDVLSTRLLIAIRERLSVRTCLLPEAALFDRLNNKECFAALCAETGARTPDTKVLVDGSAVLRELDAGTLQLPFVIKPVVGMAGSGVDIIRTRDDIDRIRHNPSRPVLVQRFIAGRDRDISILARNGRLVAYAVQFVEGGRYDFSDSAQLRDMIERFVSATGFEGVAHFDAVEEAETGNFYLIECNPRFWFSIFALLVAGMNIVALSLDPSLDNSRAPMSPRPCVVSVRKRLVIDFLRLSWRPELFRMAGYYLRDIPGIVCDHWKLFDDQRPGSGGIDDQLAQLAYLAAAAGAAESQVIPAA